MTGPPTVRLTPADAELINRFMREMRVAVTRMAQQFAVVARQFIAVFTPSQQRMLRRLVSGPPPLAINGTEYHRRQQARRRRR